MISHPHAFVLLHSVLLLCVRVERERESKSTSHLVAAGRSRRGTYSVLFSFLISPICRASGCSLLTRWPSPAQSSMFGLFGELGPLTVNADLSLRDKPYTWNAKYAMIFVD